MAFIFILILKSVRSDDVYVVFIKYKDNDKDNIIIRTC